MLLLCTCAVAPAPAHGYKCGEGRRSEDTPSPHPLPTCLRHWCSPGSMGSWGPSSCRVACSPGILDCGLPKRSFFTRAKHLVQLVTAPSDVPSRASMLLGILCPSIISFQFLKFALASLFTVGTLSAAGLQAILGQAATGDLSCLLLLAPQPPPPEWPRGICLHPLAALWCASAISLWFFVFYSWEDELGPHR